MERRTTRGGRAAGHPVRIAFRCIVLGAAGLGSLSAGCERRGVEEHAVAKGIERVPAAESASDAPIPAGTAASNDRPWTVPEGWAEDPEPRQMRLTTYIAPDASGPVEVAVTRFAGRVGGELANINRWRGQMGLGPISGDELDGVVTRFSSPGYSGYEVRIESPGGVMLAAGVYDEAVDQTWFVRATVPDNAAADRLQGDLFGMARSIAGLNS